MPRPKKNPFQLLSSAQVAAITGHSKLTVWRWVKDGKLSPVRLSRKPMFLEQELERMIRAARMEAVA